MRNVSKVLLTAGLAVAVVAIAIAQRQPMGGGFQQVTDTLVLNNKDAQTELKLTDAQKEKIAKIDETLKKAMQDARSGGKFDFEAVTKAREEATKATTDLVKNDFKPEQAKRLKQLTIQATVQLTGGLSLFSKEDIQTELKLTDKQKDKVKTIIEDTRKDAKDLTDAAKGDKDKMAEARTKITALNKKAFEEVTNGFTDDQKKVWKDMLGDETKIKFEFPQGGRPGGKDKGKDKKDA
jgi:hypothetical protein